ncbi:MAG TPA: hypothetical protein VIC27_06770 [Ktedonobacterales bacterium]|jgi:hypothetical protein
MIPAAYIPFFAASVGASGALIGLLFIAISIAPERTVGKTAEPEREAIAGNVFTALSNVFFIGLVALIPVPALGYVLVIIGVSSCLATIRLAGRLFTEGKPTRRRLGLPGVARRLALVAASLVIYGSEVWWGAQTLLGAARRDDAIIATAFLIVGGYGLVLVRMWALLGARRQSIFSWLSVLNVADEEPDSAG